MYALLNREVSLFFCSPVLFLAKQSTAMGVLEHCRAICPPPAMMSASGELQVESDL